jgi:hypothetical protein
MLLLLALGSAVSHGVLGGLLLRLPCCPCMRLAVRSSPRHMTTAPQPLQEPRLRRVHVRTAMGIKMDPERPEYHRAVAHWARPGGSWLFCAFAWGFLDVRVLLLCPSSVARYCLPAWD